MDFNRSPKRTTGSRAGPTQRTVLSAGLTPPASPFSPRLTLQFLKGAHPRTAESKEKASQGAPGCNQDIPGAASSLQGDTNLPIKFTLCTPVCKPGPRRGGQPGFGFTRTKGSAWFGPARKRYEPRRRASFPVGRIQENGIAEKQVRWVVGTRTRLASPPLPTASRCATQLPFKPPLPTRLNPLGTPSHAQERQRPPHLAQWLRARLLLPLTSSPPPPSPTAPLPPGDAQ